MNTIQSTNTGLIENPQFLSFERKIIVPPVPKFLVGDFYKNNGVIKIEECFESWVLEKSKDLELSLEEEILLNEFPLKKNAWDSDIKSDFAQNPIIPVKIFLPLLKSLIENQPKENKLDLGYNKANIFHVDLNKINPKYKIVIVCVYYTRIWNLSSSLVDFRRKWPIGVSFFNFVNNEPLIL